MNGKKSKAIRKKVYQEKDFRERKEKKIPVKRWLMPDKSTLTVHTIISDFHRTTYQRLKKLLKHVPNKNI